METFLTMVLALIIGARLGRNSILRKLTVEEKEAILKRTNELHIPYMTIQV